MTQPEKPHDQITLKISRPMARKLIGIIAGLAAICCGWYAIQTFNDWINGAWLVCLPIVLIGTIIALAWIGWKTGRLRRFRLWQVLVIVTILIVLVPVCMVSGWLVKETAEVSKGAPYPSTAIMIYMSSGPLGSKWQQDQGAWWNILCNDNQDELEDQAEEIAHKAKLGEWPNSTAFHETASDSTVELSNDQEQAKVKAHVQFVYANINPKEKWLNFRSPFRDWTFDLVNDNGWRICGLTLPDPCTDIDQKGRTQVDCDPRKNDEPSESPSATVQ